MLSEWVVALFALIASVVFFAISFTFPTVTADPGGLALFPQIAAALTGGAAAAFLVKLALRPHALAPSLQSVQRVSLLLRGHTDEGRDLRRTVFVLLLSVLYPFAVLKIGFLLASFGYSFVIVRAYRGGTFEALALSAALAVILQLFFMALEVTVPSGDWTGPLLALLGL